ncbi:thioredoxin [Cellulomonas sp. Leaf395]|uniref:thioredoxin n=1 Tax=Cellulomonas sp. Leaf395 TaxID=1736362 RepID=UPI0006F34E26|nr:thioredoxin [Cellulomonas sp. Leaf395]KQS98782.1 thioredoxin [Cellulomonas sp. Leaf395]
MSTLTLTGAAFADLIHQNDIVLVDFWAAWCGPCRRFAPVFENASEQHPDVVFAKVDTEAEHQLAAQAGITSIPTLMAFREGVLLYSEAGAVPAAALEEIIGAIKTLDMDEVRREISQEHEPTATRS